MPPQITIVRDLPYSPEVVWRSMTDPELVPLWTSAGRGGTPEGFEPRVGCHFRFVGRRVPGWDGIVRCEVLEVEAPRLLRYSWQGGAGERPTIVTYRVEPVGDGTRLTYEHTGFSGVGGLVMAQLLGRVRRRMLDEALPAVLDAQEASSARVPAPSPAGQRLRRRRGA
jgi:uncharacterized protein YndB with AHSA1/START domain